jgi:CRP-like cAMP-binding protein
VLARLVCVENETKNRLLLTLPGDDRSFVLDRCETVELVQGDMLTKAGERVRSVYFPESGVISTVALYSDGRMMEMANTGREGSSGVPAIINGNEAMVNELVQIAGTARRLKVSTLDELSDENPAFATSLQAYVKTFIYQLLVSGGCNGTHSVRARLARWLLTMHDRSDGDELTLTQEFLASMLGVHRPSVTVASNRLRDRRLIEYHRGRVRILDRSGLETESCECYAMIRNAYETLMPPVGTY